jgi:hypothetical protein
MTSGFQAAESFVGEQRSEINEPIFSNALHATSKKSENELTSR